MPNFNKTRGQFAKRFMAKSPFKGISEMLMEGAGKAIEKPKVSTGKIEGIVNTGKNIENIGSIIDKIRDEKNKAN